MEHLLKLFLFCFGAILVTGCSKNPQELDYTGLYHSPSEAIESRFSKYMDWNAGHAERVVSVPTSDYRVYFCSDIHYCEGRDALEPMLALERADAKASFIIVNGDLTDHVAGLDTVEARVGRHYDAGGDPVFYTAGNHDLFFGRWPRFFALFGSSVYVLRVQGPDYKDLFVFLDSANGLLGKSQLKWLRQQLEKQSGCRHITVVTHNNLFNQDQNQGRCSIPPLDEVYELVHLMEKHGVGMCMQSHNHYPSLTNFKGIRLLVSPALQDNGYCLVDYTSDGIFNTFKKIEY